MNYLCSLGGNKKQNKLVPKTSQIKPKEMGAVNIKTKYFRILQSTEILKQNNAESRIMNMLVGSLRE